MALGGRYDELQKELGHKAEGPVSQEDTEPIQKKISVDRTTPWSTLMTIAASSSLSPKVTDRGIQIADSYLQDLLDVGLRKAIQGAGEVGQIDRQTAHRGILRSLSEDRVAKRSVLSAMRFLRQIGESGIEEAEQEISSPRLSTKKVKPNGPGLWDLDAFPHAVVQDIPDEHEIVVMIPHAGDDSRS